MFFLLSKTLDIFAAPLTWVFVCLAFAIPWRKKTVHSKRRTRISVGAAAVILLLFSNVWVSKGLMHLLEMSAHDTSKPRQTYDAVILLGGMYDGWNAKSGPEGIAVNDNFERFIATYDLLRSDRARDVVITAGPNDGEGLTEAEALRDLLVTWGIDATRIVVERDSANTRENALFSKPLIEERGYKSLLLVTSAAHMRRAEGCFRKVGLTFDTLPVDFRATPAAIPTNILPRASNLELATRALREWLGRAVYAISGYT
jgi:uncharacterized SAM-binding protein YcdF (DUF218 family)